MIFIEKDSRLQAQEIKFPRRVKGCITRDYIRNQTIREELQIYEFNGKIKKYKNNNWKENLKHINKARLSLKALK